MKKTLNYVLAVATLVSGVSVLASCGGDSEPLAKDGGAYPVLTDDVIYKVILGDFHEGFLEARQIVSDNERFARYAESEADLLASRVMLPTTTAGGAKTINRIAPRTAPYAHWGVDAERLKGLVIANNLLKVSERDELTAKWTAARGGQGTYTASDVKTYLEGKGYTIVDTYKTTFQTAPQTWDALVTSQANDTEFIIQGLDGLVEYNNLGELKGALAVEGEDGKPYKVSEDGKVYTFKIRDDANWYKNDGTVYGKVTADDFVAGFQHMLDGDGGLDYLVDGVVKGVHEYLGKTGTFDQVGIRVNAEGDLEIELVEAKSYFPTMLTYNIFYPMSRAYFQSEGGKFGSEYDSSAANYTYGSSYEHILYNGAFLPAEVTPNSKIKFEANDAYYNKDSVVLKAIEYKYDNGEDLPGLYADCKAGDITGMGLSSTILPLAEQDGLIEDGYVYVSDTNATTYFAGWNVNRRTFQLENGGVASNKTVEAAQKYNTAILNFNFRAALSHSLDKKAWNAVSRGEADALNNVRNMYTMPNFVSVDADTTDKHGHTFNKGTTYGEMVQYYVDTKYNGEFKVQDGIDGWYNVDLAHSYIEKAVAEIGEEFFAEPIEIDIFCYSASTSQLTQAQVTKTSIENSMTVDGKKYVQVNIVDAATPDDYYNAGYYAPDGKSGDYDLFYGSGWGPDYGDPQTYLDTMLPDYAGYMTKVIGIY